MSRSVPPRPDQFEFSLFGPGRGECIVMHLGDDEWAVVDSCTSGGTTEPIALEYLHDIGVDEKQVGFILATHWHDDHIRGLAKLLNAASHARFSCSIALQTDEFARLVATADPMHRRSGVDEFAAIVKILSERRASDSQPGVAEFDWAIAGRDHIHISAPGRSFRVAIRSLTPSNATVRLALEEISRALPRIGEPQRVAVHTTPNQTSVVLWIEAGPTRLLLGADLEHISRVGEGWFGVMSHHDGIKAIAVKVPHHGSPNADCPEVWSTMLQTDCIASIAPYSSGVRPLPAPADLLRIKARTSSVYCTAHPRGGSPPRRESLVEKRMRDIARNRRVIRGECGHVRVRWSPRSASDPPRVETFSGAYQI